MNLILKILVRQLKLDQETSASSEENNLKLFVLAPWKGYAIEATRKIENNYSISLTNWTSNFRHLKFDYYDWEKRTVLRVLLNGMETVILWNWFFSFSILSKLIDWFLKETGIEFLNLKLARTFFRFLNWKFLFQFRMRNNLFQKF